MAELHIHAPPVLDRREKPLGERYCFSCRKRKQFILESTFAEWYGWNSQVICECGAIDGDCGFGYVRVYDD